MGQAPTGGSGWGAQSGAIAAASSGGPGGATGYSGAQAGLPSIPAGAPTPASSEAAPSWPLALRILPPGEESQALRQEVEGWFGLAMKQAASGPVSPQVLTEAELAITRLQRLLVRQADRLPTSADSVTQGKDFLRHLKSVLRGLK
jgi:hypothetical protein